MELINQHTKKIMEECKIKAREAGLKFGDETLEYIVTNRDMIRLHPKVSIPTMYDYWMDEVDIIKGNGEYDLSPKNPYETVINSRPAISFYNDNNPDWMNTMIFYHVLGHIDFFQNNKLFVKTWDDDFVGQALADKRLIAKLREQKGRWVDYTIEFSRGIDNLLGFFRELSEYDLPKEKQIQGKIEFYFHSFLQDHLKVSHNEFLKELERYNSIENESLRESIFLADIPQKYSEFADSFKKHNEKKKEKAKDLLEFILFHSPKIKKEENKWMAQVISIVRDTGIYFSPQIRTKILNEGWASYWHDKLFQQDERIKGHEIEYALFNSQVLTIPRVGVNPYGVGKALIEYVESLAEKGKLSSDFQKIRDIELREKYNQLTGRGREAIFNLRENFSDFTLINTFIDQDFVDDNQLFVVGQRPNFSTGKMEIYVKSKKAEDYKKILLDSLYHPPSIRVNEEKTDDSQLCLIHDFEGKQLVKDLIANTMIGIEFLYGGRVQLETTEVLEKEKKETGDQFEEGEREEELEWQRVRYTMENKKLSKEVIQ